MATWDMLQTKNETNQWFNYEERVFFEVKKIEINNHLYATWYIVQSVNHIEDLLEKKNLNLMWEVWNFSMDLLFGSFKFLFFSFK